MVNKVRNGVIFLLLLLFSILMSFSAIKVYKYYKGKVDLTDTEIEWLKNNKIILAPDPDLYPIEYKSGDEKYSGLSADYMRLIEKKIGKNFEVKWYKTWKEIEEAIKNRKVDISTFIVRTKEREKYIHFTSPYLKINMVFAVTHENNLDDTENMTGKTIGIVEDYVMQSTLENDPNYILETAENIPALFSGLISGKFDAIVLDEITALNHIKKNDYKNIKFVKEYGAGFLGGLGIASDNTPLINIMDKAVESISEYEMKELQAKWLTREYSKKIDIEYKVWIIIFNIIFVTIGILLFIWNKLLQNKVDEKNKDLKIVSQFFDNAKEGMFVVNIDGIIENVNQSFLKMTGYIRDEIIGKKQEILNSEKTEEGFYTTKLKKELEKEKSWEGELWLKKKDDDNIVVWISVYLLNDKNGEPSNYIYIMEDLTSYKKKQENINWLSNYDLLTGLPNQMLFRDRLNQTMKKYTITKKRFAVMYIDVNNFKIINENLGYAKGDNVLFMIAERLKNIISPVYTLARVSGDHFIMLIPYIDSLKELEGVAKKLLFAFNEKFVIDGKDFFINLSLGIAVYPEDQDANHGVMNSAFKALKHSKKTGKNSYQFYSNELGTNIKEKLRMDSLLREAVTRNELYLNYQPQLDLNTNKIVGMEALVRWNSPELGIVSPGTFIPLAEENGMIVKIGEWVLEKACEDIKTILLKGYDTRVSVNLSPIQFKQKNLLDMIQSVVRKWNIPPYLVELEITESIFLDNVKRNIYILNEIREMSMKIALDDFGTGYSSLSYLQNFKFDRLKLDQSFVRNMDRNENRKICETIIDLAHKLGLKSIAEGVETKEHFDFLREKKCDEIQGYYFSRPIMFEDMLKLLEKTNKLED